MREQHKAEMVPCMADIMQISNAVLAPAKSLVYGDATLSEFMEDSLQMLGPGMQGAVLYCQTTCFLRQ